MEEKEDDFNAVSNFSKEFKKYLLQILQNTRKSPRHCNQIHTAAKKIFVSNILPHWFKNGSCIKLTRIIYKIAILPAIDAINQKKGDKHNKIIFHYIDIFKLAGTENDARLYNEHFSGTPFHDINKGWPLIKKIVKGYFDENKEIENLLLVIQVPYVYQDKKKCNLQNSKFKLCVHADSLIFFCTDYDKIVVQLLNRNGVYWNKSKSSMYIYISLHFMRNCDILNII